MPVHKAAPFTIVGRVVARRGAIIIAILPYAAIGDVCYINCRNKKMPAEVVAFAENEVHLAPYDHIEGLELGATVSTRMERLAVPVGDTLLGKVVDAVGICKDPLSCAPMRFVVMPPPDPTVRTPIIRKFQTGIKAIDRFVPMGVGQRIALLAQAGTGKSTLLAQIAHHSQAERIVIALVGERGREVAEFLHTAISPVALARTVTVVATSDETPFRRALAPYTATTIAEEFRRQGKDVLLLVDSLTRTARALREIGLATGELPVRHGYTPSVFTQLPRLLERAGNDNLGSITALYTMLSGGDNEADPLSEEVKSLLDGHIILTRELAEQGIWPAVDIAKSLSRLTTKLLNKEEQIERMRIISAVAKARNERDLMLLGGVADSALLDAIKIEQQLNKELSQPNY